MSEQNENRKGSDNRTLISIADYIGIPAQVENLGSISYDEALGSEMDILQKRRIAGVCKIEYLPTFGRATGKGTDPVNLAATQNYIYVRHANSGARNYETNNLMMVTLAIASLHSLLQMARRAVGIVNYYNTRNRYYGKVLCEACGFDFNDLTSNLPNMREMLNTFATQLNGYYVPQIFPVINLWTKLNTVCIADMSISKHQTYIFVPKITYKFREGNTASGGMELVSKNLPDRFTKSSFELFFKDLLDSVAASEDINMICGDMLKAYGSAAALVTDNNLTSEYRTPIIKDDTVLKQFMNAQFVGPSYQLDDTTQTVGGEFVSGKFSYYESGQFLTCGYIDDVHNVVLSDAPTKANSYHTLIKSLWDNFDTSGDREWNFKFCKNITELNKSKILNQYDEEVSPDKNIINAQLKSHLTVEPVSATKDNYACILESFGPVVLYCVKIYTLDPSRPDGALHLDLYDNALSYSDWNEEMIEKLSQFNYMFLYFIASDKTNTLDKFRCIYDFGNYAILPNSTFKRIIDVELQHMLGATISNAILNGVFSKSPSADPSGKQRSDKGFNKHRHRSKKGKGKKGNSKSADKGGAPEVKGDSTESENNK